MNFFFRAGWYVEVVTYVLCQLVCDLLPQTMYRPVSGQVMKKVQHTAAAIGFQQSAGRIVVL